MQHFTRNELARIQQTLRKRFGVHRDPNLVDVAFGVALRKSQADFGRRFSAVFFVRRKHDPKAAASRIPREVRIRFKRGQRYQSAVFPTDVVEYSPYVASGRRLFDGVRELGAVGAVISWQVRPGGPRQWGLLTAGHVLQAVQSAFVTIEGINNASFAGRVVLRSRPGEAVDAAIVQIRPQDLEGHAIFAPVNEPAEEPFWSLEQLQHSVERATELGESLRGTSFRPGGSAAFDVLHFWPTTRPGVIVGFGALENVIEARGLAPAVAPAFEVGSSGSIWSISGLVAGLQVAADQATRTIGLGQALWTIKTWAVQSLSRVHPPTIADLRFNTAF